MQSHNTENSNIIIDASTSNLLDTNENDKEPDKDRIYVVFTLISGYIGQTK